MQNFPFQVQVEFLFASTQNTQNALEALQPDLNNPHEKRSQTTLKTNKTVLAADIRALDEKALKGSMQRMFKAIALIQKMQAINLLKK